MVASTICKPLHVIAHYKWKIEQKLCLLLLLLLLLLSTIINLESILITGRSIQVHGSTETYYVLINKMPFISVKSLFKFRVVTISDILFLCGFSVLLPDCL